MTEPFPCTVAGRVTRTPDVESFSLLPERPVPFLAGQFVQVLLDPGAPGNHELNKFLSLSAPPGAPLLEVTKRLSASAFSARLRALREGDRVLLRGPFGDCVLRPEDRKVAFLAGGIGITPVVSMVADAAAHRPDLAMHVFHACRAEADFAFREDLERRAAADPNLAVHLFLTSGTPRDPRITAGRPGPEALLAALPEPASWVYFIFGPPPMVEALRVVCAGLGVPEAQIRLEGFTGA